MDYKDVCVTDRQLPIHQLNKLNEKGTKREDVFPISVVQAIFDKTGIRLDTIISSFNYIFLPYKGTKEDTRLQVNGLMRRKSLVICYRDLDDNITIEMYISNDRGDNSWKNDNNWKDFGDWVSEAIKDIMGNLDNYPDIFEQIKNAIYAAIEEYLDQNASAIVNKWIEENASELITTAVNEYISSDTFINNLNENIKTLVNNYLAENLEPLVGEFFTAVVNYVQQNERVIANALARHEQAITDLQNTDTQTT